MDGDLIARLDRRMKRLEDLRRRDMQLLETLIQRRKSGDAAIKKIADDLAELALITRRPLKKITPECRVCAVANVVCMC